jgi:hypothetical protein
MSHPDPLFDPDNAYEDDDMIVEHDPSDTLFIEYLYDGHDDFYEDVDDTFDDSMDGDTESALASAGWGTDEDYGYYGEDVDYCDADDCGYYGEDY